MLGLPYSAAIDMWSLGCILAEMHSGEPLFPGSHKVDQIQKIVKLLGMIPVSMLNRSSQAAKIEFFEQAETASDQDEWRLRQTNQATSTDTSVPMEPEATIVPSTDPIASLKAVVVAGNGRKKKFPISETYKTARDYELFVDLLFRMLAYRPEDRIKPEEALYHPFFA
jgi:serine/threonine protein kinase